MNHKLLYANLTIALLLILASGFVSAEDKTLGKFTVNSCVVLKQTCSTSECTYVNITGITDPDSRQILGNVVMTKIGTEYNYTFCNTSKQGEYIYTTLGGNATTQLPPQPVSFLIGSNNLIAPLGLFIIVIAIIYSVGFIGFFAKNVWVAMLGGMAMIALGIFTINNGIDIYRNFITNIFSWTTIGIGALFALTAGLDIIQDSYN